MNFPAVAAIVAGAVVISLIPWAVAVGRGHKNATPILVICLFFGWTLVGWVLALVWALMADQERAARRKYARPTDDGNPFA